MKALDRYVQASEATETALAAIAAETAGLASPDVPAAEYLELLRLQLHRRIDDLVDAEALRHPSPLRCIARTIRYAELLHGGIFGPSHGEH